MNGGTSRIIRAENKNTVVSEKDEALLSFVSFFIITKIEMNSTYKNKGLVEYSLVHPLSKMLYRSNESLTEP